MAPSRCFLPGVARGAGEKVRTQPFGSEGCSVKPVGRLFSGNERLIRAVALKYVLFSVLSPYIF